MATRILIGHEQGEVTTGLSNEQAVLFDSVTGWAFGPLFREGEDGTSAEERAQAFLDWLGQDPRSVPAGDLETLYGRWLKGEDPNWA